MDQPPRTHKAVTWQRRQFLIEKYALLTENASDLREKLDWWLDFYRPASPGECEQVDIIVMASVHIDRLQQHLTEVVNQQIRTAVFDHDNAQLAHVERYRAMLATDPGAALVGLKKSVLGLRFLIQRWQRLLDLLYEEGTWYGQDIQEAVTYQGAKGSKAEDLYASEGAYLTNIYCLMTQADPNNKDLREMGSEHVMPTAIRDRKPEHWLPLREHCRQLLIELAESELASLWSREAVLRLSFDEPARDSAEVRRQVLASPEGARIVRQLQIHQQQFQRAYDAFLKGRKHSEKSGQVPGAPIPGIHFQADDVPVVEPDARPVKQAQAEGRESPITRSVMPTVGVPVNEARRQRKQMADAVAPGGDNGIGAPVVRGDVFRAAAVSTGFKPLKYKPGAWDNWKEGDEWPAPDCDALGGATLTSSF
jgi:hypothetical protein